MQPIQFLLLTNHQHQYLLGNEIHLHYQHQALTPADLDLMIWKSFSQKVLAQ